jgi:hypothetical protein
VHIDLDSHDRRIFVPTPHGSPSWERGYNCRSARPQQIRSLVQPIPATG